MMYAKDELIKGVRWAIINNHFEALLKYDLENRQSLKSLDEFELYKIPSQVDMDETERVLSY